MQYGSPRAKAVQRDGWTRGNYEVIGETLRPATEHMVALADVKPGERVLDVATGTGIAAIAARRGGASVVGVDFAPALLATARQRAQEAGVDVEFLEMDAEDLRFPDGSFDVVVSSFGHMFAPDQAKAGRELLRVLRPGGRFAFVAMTPEGGQGQLFELMARRAPPPPGLPNPLVWGREDDVLRLLGPEAVDVRFTRGDCPARAQTPQDLWRMYVEDYGPLVQLLPMLPPAARLAIESDAVAYFSRFEVPEGGVAWSREYLVTTGRRAGGIA